MFLRLSDTLQGLLLEDVIARDRVPQLQNACRIAINSSTPIIFKESKKGHYKFPTFSGDKKRQLFTNLNIASIIEEPRASRIRNLWDTLLDLDETLNTSEILNEDDIALFSAKARAWVTSLTSSGSGSPGDVHYDPG